MANNQLPSKDFIDWPIACAAQYRAHKLWQDHSINDLLQQTTTRYPHKCALICGDKQWSYYELDQDINRLANGYQTLGLKQNDTAIIHLPNCAALYLNFFALLRIGVKPLLAMPAHRFNELDYFCQFIEARIYISAQQNNFDPIIIGQRLKQKHDHLQWLIDCDNIAPEPIKTNDWLDVPMDNAFIPFSSLFNKNAPLANIINPDFAFFQLSGGSTGLPKFIPRTDNDYVYSVRASVEICQFDQHTHYLCVLPAGHNFPLSSPGALGVWQAGGTVVLSPQPDPESTFKLIQQHQITVTALVPPLALLWLEYAQQHKHQLSSLKLVQIGGAKLSAEAAKKFISQLDCQLQQVFGMAEGLVNYTRLDDDLDTIINTQGRPMSAFDNIKIVDDQGVDVKQGEEGLLLVKGPYTICGYYKAPEHNRNAFTPDGFYITGDTVKLTKKGNLQVLGRQKDQINRGGEKIAAEEIENALLAHPEVHDAAIIALPDPFLGEKSCAVVVCKNLQPNAIELKRFLRQHELAAFKIPDRIEFLSHLPKTPVGKIDKKQLRAQF
ncbi:(2,3-dihydroxybenzoyl)adenylate synthase [Algibacillus agarilyticus]|uniref:(2,3-dihydroxybenzoyl)adenylate synthase n=1 Tax=Algibacillus agarilyticus TaxID=2234133 RepID=UPI000DD0803C|nr:(2,3-dihydroxybenzoyl)adenylate synthase [Algibacillus agarilyticus]